MAKVLNSFQDKVTQAVYHPGDIYEGDRAEELAELGFVEKAAKAPKKAKTTKADK